jgi:hypothetical protein
MERKGRTHNGASNKEELSQKEREEKCPGDADLWEELDMGS